MLNLIIILFNLFYHVFIVRFNCKGSVWERERAWRPKQIEDWRVFADSLRLCIPRNDACALHMTGMWRVRTEWRQLCFASSSWVRPSHETLAKHSFLSDCPIWYTLSVSTLYIPTLPTNVEECFWEKILATNLKELEIVILTYLYTFACGFSSTPTSPFPYHWEVGSPNTYHTLSECQVRIWCCWEALEEARLWRMQSGILRDSAS